MCLGPVHFLIRAVVLYISVQCVAFDFMVSVLCVAMECVAVLCYSPILHPCALCATGCLPRVDYESYPAKKSPIEYGSFA